MLCGVNVILYFVKGYLSPFPSSVSCAMFPCDRVGGWEEVDTLVATHSAPVPRRKFRACDHATLAFNVE